MNREFTNMILVENSNGRKTSVGNLRTFRCVPWEHISDKYRNKLEAKSHACIMMGYYDESKSYILFDPIKQKIILRIIVIFYEHISSNKLLNSSFGLLHNDIFDIIEESILIVPSYVVTTRPMNYVSE